MPAESVICLIFVAIFAKINLLHHKIGAKLCLFAAECAIFFHFLQEIDLFLRFRFLPHHLPEARPEEDFLSAFRATDEGKRQQPRRWAWVHHRTSRQEVQCHCGLAAGAGVGNQFRNTIHIFISRHNLLLAILYNNESPFHFLKVPTPRLY